MWLWRSVWVWHPFYDTLILYMMVRETWFGYQDWEVQETFLPWSLFTRFSFWIQNCVQNCNLSHQQQLELLIFHFKLNKDLLIDTIHSLFLQIEPMSSLEAYVWYILVDSLLYLYTPCQHVHRFGVYNNNVVNSLLLWIHAFRELISTIMMILLFPH